MSTACRPRRLRPPLPAFWLWLAMAAALLMAIAPVVSYGLQALAQGHADHSAHTGTHPLSGAHETGQVHTPTTQASAHASHAVDHGHHPVASPATAHTDSHPAGHGLATIAADPTADAAASNPHAEHGAACDYCLIAARALGVLLALLWLLPSPASTGTACVLGRATFRGESEVRQPVSSQCPNTCGSQGAAPRPPPSARTVDRIAVRTTSMGSGGVLSLSAYSRSER